MYRYQSGPDRRNSRVSGLPWPRVDLLPVCAARLGSSRKPSRPALARYSLTARSRFGSTGSAASQARQDCSLARWYNTATVELAGAGRQWSSCGWRARTAAGAGGIQRAAAVPSGSRAAAGGPGRAGARHTTEAAQPVQPAGLPWPAARSAAEGPSRSHADAAGSKA